jgi:L,D-peptidoglycan transpeptidase YkuD (ErfK/YbiS/YcfS/YnhG family)
LREVLYRPDRGPKPATALPVSTIAAADAWSDDPADPAYNQRVTTPRPFHSETLWRSDALYDVLAVIGANDSPVLPGRGSAIFLHIAPPKYGGTDGCVGVARGDLLRILAQCGRQTVIAIG